jgi:hypothetical protein
MTLTTATDVNTVCGSPPIRRACRSTTVYMFGLERQCAGIAWLTWRVVENSIDVSFRDDQDVPIARRRPVRKRHRDVILDDNIIAQSFTERGSQHAAHSLQVVLRFGKASLRAHSVN